MDLRSLLGVFALNILIFQEVSAGYLIEKDHSRNNSVYQEKSRHFRYIVSGFDYEDRPVLIMEWGKWDLVWLTDHPEFKDELLKNYDNLMEEIVTGDFGRKLSKFLPIGYNSSDQFVAIKDYAGFELRNAFKPAATQLLVNLFAKLERVVDKLAYAIVVNGNPVVNMMAELAKPLAGKVMSKLDVYGTNREKWLPQITKKIPLDQLPHALGGKEDFRPIREKRLLQ